MNEDQIAMTIVGLMIGMIWVRSLVTKGIR